MTDKEHEDDAVYVKKTADAVKQLLELNRIENAKDLLRTILTYIPDHKLRSSLDQINSSYPDSANYDRILTVNANTNNCQNNLVSKANNVTASDNYYLNVKNQNLDNHSLDNSNIKEKCGKNLDFNKREDDPQDINEDQKHMSAGDLNIVKNNIVVNAEDSAFVQAKEIALIEEVMANSFEIRALILAMEIRVLREGFICHSIEKPEQRIFLVTSFTKMYDRVVLYVNTAINKWDNKEEAVRWLELAETLYEDTKNMLPKKIKSMNDDRNESNKFPLNSTLKHVPGERTKATIKGNEGDENICLHKALKAYKDSDYNRAKKFLDKAMRINPNPNELTKQLMRQVKDAQEDIARATEVKKNEEDSRQKCRDIDEQRALKFVNLASIALDEKDYDGAEDNVLKAQNIWPLVKVDKLLLRIREGKNQRAALQADSGESENATETIELPPSSPNKEETLVINLFRKSFEVGHFDTAKNILMNAQARFPELQVDEYLKEIDAALRKKKNAEDANKRREKEVLLNLVKRAINIENIDTAEKLLRQFKSQYPKYNVSELESFLENARAQKAAEKHQTYLNDALNANTAGHYDKAEELLENAKKEFPDSKIINDTLSQVRAVRASKSSSKDTVYEIEKDDDDDEDDDNSSNIEDKKKESQKFFNLAVEAFSKKEYKTAQNLATAHFWFPSNEIDTLVQKMYDSLNSPEPASTGPDFENKCIYCSYPKSTTNPEEDKLYEQVKLYFVDKRHPCQRCQSLLSTIENALSECDLEIKNSVDNEKQDDKNSESHRPHPVIESIGEENARTAREFIDKAKEFLNNNNYIKAERLLQKAERIDPSGEEARKLLEQVHALVKTTKANANPSTSANSKAMEKKINNIVETLDDLTSSHLRKRHYEAAELFAQLAYKTKQDKNTKTNLAKALEIIKTEGTKLTTNQKQKRKINGKNDMDKLCELVKKEIYENNVQEAEKILIVATQLFVDDKNYDMLADLFEKLHKKKCSRQLKNNYVEKSIMVIESKEYLKKAQAELESGCDVIGTFFLQEAERLNEYCKKDVEQLRRKFSTKKKESKSIANRIGSFVCKTAETLSSYFS